MINSRQKEMMIRSALGEKRKRQFLQYLIENSVISFITTTIAYILNITIISKVIEAMFKRSIETQNDLKRIATGELGAFDELYELSRYNILNIQITDYFITLLIILILVTIASLLSFFTQKKNDYRTFLNGWWSFTLYQDIVTVLVMALSISFYYGYNYQNKNFFVFVVVKAI